MTRDEHPSRLLAYLDGELSVTEGERIEQHLASCDRCARELRGYQDLHARLDEALLPETGPGLWDELRPRLEAGRVRRVRRLGWAVYGMVMLLGLGAGGWAGWSMGKGLEEEPSPELLAETSLYDLPAEGFAEEYLGFLGSEDDQEVMR